MKKILEHQYKWIWTEAKTKPDEYAHFIDNFQYEKKDGEVILNISVDSNYTLWVNGVMCGFSQYADYPHYKIFDEIDITKYLVIGENKIAILAWYYGCDSQVYKKNCAGLLFEITQNNQILCYSSEKTLSRLAPDYEQHLCKIITYQMGYSFKYKMSNYDFWEKNNYEFENRFHLSTIVSGITYDLKKRPVKKLEIKDRSESVLIKSFSETNHLFDLKKERVGFLELDINSEEDNEIIIYYGEHIVDGEVRKIINGRDFSVEYISKKGDQNYINTFRRLGCRYLQIVSKKPMNINYLGIREVAYPVNEVVFDKGNSLEKKIYQICIDTLKLCMHEHYEDCPWREQALYTMDSRNQMLCGYYAFNEFEFARANILLISKGLRQDGLLSLCFPAGIDFPIPFFSLIYFVQVDEYIKFSKDLTILDEIYDVLKIIIKTFMSKINKNGLVANFEKGFWNFYEWSDGLDGYDIENPLSFDLPLNAGLVLALKSMINISKLYNKVEDLEKYQELYFKLQNKIIENFYDNKNGLFATNLNKHRDFSVLSNSLAICALDDIEKFKDIGDKLLNDNHLVNITLSMKCFEYDALLKLNKEKYSKLIISDINNTYKMMLDGGATTCWETKKGEADFNGAGSLCHGWSAMPIYYYNILL